MSKPTTALDTPITESGFQQINGHDLYWEIFGSHSDKNIVLLHHGLGSTRSWKRQIQFLVQNGFRVILHDRWGYGRSESRQEFSPRFLHTDAEETVKLLQTLGIKNASFMGHSDGGSIAIIIASRYPSVVDSLILVAAHIYIEPKMTKGLRAIQLASNSSPLKEVLKQEHGAGYPSLVKAWINSWDKHGPMTLELQGELKHVSCPTLVIQGEEDEHATPKHAKDIAQKITDADLWLIPNVGHMPIHEIPEQFNKRIIRFLIDKVPEEVSIQESKLESDNVQ